MNQVGLRRPQLAQRGFGGVPRRADLLLRTLTLGDVAVDQDKAAARHGIAPDLDDPPVRARPLEAHFPLRIFNVAAHLRLKIGRAIFAAIGEIAEVLRKARPTAEEGVRQIEHLLKITVPRGKPQLLVEPGDTVGHIVESDTQHRLLLAELGGALLDLVLQTIGRLGALGQEGVAFDRVLAEHLDRPIAAISSLPLVGTTVSRPPSAIANIAPLNRLRRRTILRPT